MQGAAPWAVGGGRWARAWTAPPARQGDQASLTHAHGARTHGAGTGGSKDLLTVIVAKIPGGRPECPRRGSRDQMRSQARSALRPHGMGSGACQVAPPSVRQGFLSPALSYGHPQSTLRRSQGPKKPLTQGCLPSLPSAGIPDPRWGGGSSDRATAGPSQESGSLGCARPWSIEALGK